jgi:signal transduction histidine kinase
MGETLRASNTQQLRIRVAYLERIAEISRDLNSTLSLDPLLLRIVEGARELADCEACSIILLDENSRELKFAKSTSEEESRKLRQLTIPANSIAGHVVRTGEPLFVDDTKEDGRWSSDVDVAIAFDTRSMIAIPLMTKGEVIGVMELINKVGGMEFTDDDVRVATTLAANAAVAIENARLMERLQRAYDDLAELDRLKSDFLSIASHELRTPLSAVLVYSAMLQEELMGDAAERITMVLDNAVKLRNIIDDLVNLRHVDTGQAVLQRSNVDLSELLNDVVCEFSQVIQYRGLRFFMSVPQGIPVLSADRRKLYLLFTNLLSNAVKFTAEGGRIQISVEVKTNEVWVSVADTGIGIPPEEQDRIFERFFQVERSLDRNYEGLGLGLSTSKSMVELHGGRIWVESVPGKGSRFTVALPLAGGDD